jgi:hypothetical protein
VLREHCQAVGRPYEEIEKTVIDNFGVTRDGRNHTLSPNAAIDRLAALAEVGIEHVIFTLYNVIDLEAFDVLATQVIPEVEKIGVAGRSL